MYIYIYIYTYILYIYLYIFISIYVVLSKPESGFTESKLSQGQGTQLLIDEGN